MAKHFLVIFEDSNSFKSYILKDYETGNYVVREASIDRLYPMNEPLSSNASDIRNSMSFSVRKTNDARYLPEILEHICLDLLFHSSKFGRGVPPPSWK